MRTKGCWWGRASCRDTPTSLQQGSLPAPSAVPSAESRNPSWQLLLPPPPPTYLPDFRPGRPYLQTHLVRAAISPAAPYSSVCAKLAEVAPQMPALLCNPTATALPAERAAPGTAGSVGRTGGGGGEGRRPSRKGSRSTESAACSTWGERGALSAGQAWCCQEEIWDARPWEVIWESGSAAQQVVELTKA